MDYYDDLIYIKDNQAVPSSYAMTILEFKNLSSKDNSPLLSKSKAIIEVIILVIDAGNICLSELVCSAQLQKP